MPSRARRERAALAAQRAEATALHAVAPVPANDTPKQPPPETRRPSWVEFVLVFSDVHFDREHKTLWEAACDAVRVLKPDRIVFPGDMVDLGQCGRYGIESGETLNAVEQVKRFVEQVNRLWKHTARITALTGNHDERWEKYLRGPTPFVLDGAKGITLHEQCLFQGLNPTTEWVTETREVPGVIVGDTVIHHAHAKVKGGTFGTVNIAAKRIREGHGRSEGMGHVHRAGITTHSAYDEVQKVTTFPTMAGYFTYAGTDPNWQRGCASYEVHDGIAWPALHLWQKGRMVIRGHVFDGR